jgi:hypothetical protein
MKENSDEIRIAGDFKSKDWKKLRNDLLNDIKNDVPSKEKWGEAFKIFEERVTTRFLTPIKLIINHGSGGGEGFSVVALQCILIEFFEAFYEGKIYTPSRDETEIDIDSKKYKTKKEILIKQTNPNEYHSSSGLFKNFLRGHPPFNQYFTSNTLADRFFTEIRCGLLHEAATKGDSRILMKQNGDMLIERVKGKSMIVYRNNFQNALKEFLKKYRNELLEKKNLQIGFLRKMDELAGIKRIYYFAYGSNLKKDQLIERINQSKKESDKQYLTPFHMYHMSFLKGYKLKINKKGDDGTSKANICEAIEKDKVWGVCYEMDKDAFLLLNDYEIGYVPIDVLTETTDGQLIKAKTFISTKITDTLPDPEYVKTIIDGAKEMGLPDDYISYHIKVNIRKK